MKKHRDIFILAGLFVALIAFLVISQRLRPPDVDPSFPTTHSREPLGAQALYTWLGQLGYTAQRLEYREFTLAEGDSALIVLNPSETITEDHADEMLRWVDQGGTLIMADDSNVTFSAQNALLDDLRVAFEVYTSTQILDEPLQLIAPLQPAFNQPPLGELRANTGRVVVAPDQPDLVGLVGVDNATVIAGLKYGRGYIYFSSASYPFTNQGLRETGSGELVLNMLRRVPSNGRILFDEYHLGYFEPPSTTTLVLGSPIGWALTYAVFAIGLYMILSGRRFGRPIPLKAETARRSSAEYVSSMADLLQRGGKTSFIAQHYHTAFKRRLARRHGLNPRTEDREFVRELGRNSDVDETRILDLLSRMRGANNEDALMRVVSEAETVERYHGSS